MDPESTADAQYCLKDEASELKAPLVDAFQPDTGDVNMSHRKGCRIDNTLTSWQYHIGSLLADMVS